MDKTNYVNTIKYRQKIRLNNYANIRNMNSQIVYTVSNQT